MALYPNDQSNPAGAIPVYQAAQPGGGGFTDRSTTIVPGEADTVVAYNAQRCYLLIQAVGGGGTLDLWINMVGGIAAPNTEGSFKLPAGSTFQSGPVVPSGPISIYSMGSAPDTIVTIYEG